MKIAFSLLFLLLLSHRSPASEQPPAAPSTASPPQAQPLTWNSTIQEVAAEAQARFVTFTFSVTNTSSQPVAILATHSSCECTVAELPNLPWTFAPGTTGSFQVRMNVVGRFGGVTKTILVETTHGTQALTVKARIPITPAPFNVSARKMDLATARKDPQAIFKNGCAACHALPTVGRHGATLFEKACAICHIAEHRAEMVPDLAALSQPRNATYWRNIITHGKPGSLMPAFAKSQGGILEPSQIDSLVDYLLQTYPSPKQTGSGRPQIEPTPP